MCKPETISDWQSLVDTEIQFDRLSEEQEWVFRGQPAAKFPLDTTLERACKELRIESQFIPHIEKQLIFDFRRSYDLFAKHAPPEGDDALEWLSLMRHYGTPTRLLDFTYSFFIAAYFALEYAKEDAAIWAINKSWLIEQTRQLLADKAGWRAPLFERYMSRRGGKEFTEIFMSSVEPVKLVSPVNPFRLNDRLTVQQGLFLCPGDIASSFSANLNELRGAVKNVIPVVLRESGRLEILRKLHRLGINRSLLFPGLEGFAESMRTKMLIFEQMRKMEKTGARKIPFFDSAL